MAKKSDITEVQVKRVFGEHGISPMERAEIEIAVSTAKKYPRVISEFRTKCSEMALIDEETASSCFYSLPRAGKTIPGISIRLAEIAAISWQNILAGADIVGEDEKYVYADGICRDLENNVTVKIKVRRRITKSNGERYDNDMIAVTGAAVAAIAYRNAVLKIVPLALLKPIYEECKRVAVGNARTFSDKRKSTFDRLKQMGVLPDRILARVGCKTIDDITAEKLLLLIGLSNALRDGATSIESAFPEPVSAAATDEEVSTVGEALDDAQQRIEKSRREKEAAAKARADAKAKGKGGKKTSKSKTATKKTTGMKTEKTPAEPKGPAKKNLW